MPVNATCCKTCNGCHNAGDGPTATVKLEISGVTQCLCSNYNSGFNYGYIYQGNVNGAWCLTRVTVGNDTGGNPQCCIWAADLDVPIIMRYQMATDCSGGIGSYYEVIFTKVAVKAYFDNPGGGAGYFDNYTRFIIFFGLDAQDL